MERKDYYSHYKRLSLTKEQKKLLSDKLENDFMQHKHSNVGGDGFFSFFNDLWWYFEGECDTQDIFFESDEPTLSVNVVNDIQENKIQTAFIERFWNFLKQTLTPLQLEILYVSLEKLYLRPKGFVEKKFYFKSRYQFEKMSAEITFLKLLRKENQ